jgi:hypothetical protein
MAKALPKNPRPSTSWTPLQRRTWLAEQRRKHHLLPAPVLRAAYPTLLRWDWDLPNPYKWNFWLSWDDGVSWNHVEDYWKYGDAREFAPDGGSELYYIVGVDASGREITQHSNFVRPDDAPAPLAAPTLALVGGFFVGTAPVAASVWRFAQNDGVYDGFYSTIQDWADNADLADASYDLLPPNQAQSEQQFGNCSCRYQVAGVWSPWCAVI